MEIFARAVDGLTVTDAMNTPTDAFSKRYGDYIELQKHLSSRFNTKVELKRNEKGRGKIIIGFKSDAELEKIIELLDKIE